MLELQRPRQARTTTAISKEVEKPKRGMKTVDAVSPEMSTGRRPMRSARIPMGMEPRNSANAEKLTSRPA
jgi:hypothetical protein